MVLQAFGVTWAMSHLRAFVANQGLSRIRAFFMSCPDFYSDIEDFAQILCRYLLKKIGFWDLRQVVKTGEPAGRGSTFPGLVGPEG